MFIGLANQRSVYLEFIWERTSGTILTLDFFQTVAAGNVIEVDNTKEIQFYVDDGGSAPDCSFANQCLQMITLTDVGMNDNMDSGSLAAINVQYGVELKLAIPSFSAAGSHGFCVHMFNGISELRVDYNDPTR